MAPDDPRVRAFLKQSMNMRVATLSTTGVPHITPLRFVYDGRTISALPGAAAPTARHISARPRVILLFDAERTTGPVLRVEALAAIRSERHLMRRYEQHAALKYFLPLGGIWNTLTHLRLFLGGRRLRRENALIEFAPQVAEFVPRPGDLTEPELSAIGQVLVLVEGRNR